MDWTSFRAEFPVTQCWAYLDHAAVAPLSARAAVTLSSWTDEVAHNGVVVESRWLRRVEAARQAVARLLNAQPADVAFVKNTSEGIGLVAEGLAWKPGDNVVSAQGEYPANVYPWLNLADRGVELRAIPTREGRILLDDIRAAIDSRTRLVALSYVEFASGFRNDLDAVGSLCREKGVLFFVDAIQGLGVLPLDVQRTPIDFLSADGHKWLVSPEGAGVFWVRREALSHLRPVGVGWNSVVGAWDFSTIDFTLKPHAGRYESGTLPLGSLAALGASVELLLEAGIDSIAQRVLELTDLLCEKARSAGLEVCSSRREGERSGIVSLGAPGRDPGELVKRCRAEGVVISQRGGRLRASPHAYTTAEEIERLVRLLGGPT